MIFQESVIPSHANKIQRNEKPQELYDFVNDAWRFLLLHRDMIEIAPLQVYTSALLFSPTNSLINRLYNPPDWITVRPKTREYWDNCLQTFNCGSTSLLDKSTESLAFSSDGKKLASSDSEGTITIWGVTSGFCIHIFEEKFDAGSSFAFSPDDTRLASCSYADGTIRLRDVDSGNLIRTFGSPANEVESIAFSPDGQKVASLLGDETIEIWHTMSGICLKTLVEPNQPVYGTYTAPIAFSPNGKQIITGSCRTGIRIWDVESGVCSSLDTGIIDAIAIARGGRRAATCSPYPRGQKIDIWDITSGNCVQTIEIDGGKIQRLAILADGQKIASISGIPESIKIWDVTSGDCVQSLNGNGDDWQAVAFSTDGQRLAAGSDHGLIKIWDINATTNDCELPLERHSDAVFSVAISHDGQRVASGSSDNTIKLWDASSGTCLMTLDGHAGAVESVAFSDDGQRIASGSFDKTVKVWELTSGDCVRTLDDHADCVMSVAFSHDGQRIASGSYDKTVKVWDATSGNRLLTLDRHTNTVTLVIFSHDGRRIASGSWDDTIIVWDVTSGNCIQALKRRTSHKPVVISHDGLRSGAGSYITDILVFDVTSGNCEHTLRAEEPEVYDLLNPDIGPECSVSSNQIRRRWGISYAFDWVIEDGIPLFWLPYEYRPRDQFEVTAAGSMIVISCQSGQVLIIGLKDSPSRSLQSKSL